MVTELAALVFVAGNACILTDHKSVCSTGIWLTCTIIAALSVVADPYYQSTNRIAFTVLLVAFSIFLELGLMKELVTLKE